MADSKVEDTALRLKKARDFKKEGAKLFKDGNFEKAIDEYRKISENLEGQEMVGKNEAERKNLVLAAKSNIAKCYMELEEWKRAKTMWSEILETTKGTFGDLVVLFGLLNRAQDFKSSSAHASTVASCNSGFICQRQIVHYNEKIHYYQTKA